MLNVPIVKLVIIFSNINTGTVSPHHILTELSVNHESSIIRSTKYYFLLQNHHHKRSKIENNIKQSIILSTTIRIHHKK